MAKMDQLQKSFVKDNLSLNGLFEMQTKVENFEKSITSGSPDFDQLTRGAERRYELDKIQR